MCVLTKVDRPLLVLDEAFKTHYEVFFDKYYVVIIHEDDVELGSRSLRLQYYLSDTVHSYARVTRIPCEGSVSGGAGPL